MDGDAGEDIREPGVRIDAIHFLPFMPSLDGHNQLPKLVLGVTSNDGIEVIAKPTDRQPITAAA
jgi:hypothetical protein